MLVLVQFLTKTLIVMMMKSEAASDPITVSAQSGETVMLSTDQQGLRLDSWSDVRWTHHHLLLSLKNNLTTFDHGRCELLGNGSLRFSPVHVQDSGNYSQQVFNQHGIRQMRTDFLLRVEGESQSNMSLLIGRLLLLGLLLVFIIVFIFIFTLRKRFLRTRTAGAREEHVYVWMHSYRSNKWKDDQQQEKEEESAYVPCNPAVSMETPITKQMSLEADDIYV